MPGAGNALPLVHYHRAEALDRLGRDSDADAARAAAREVDAAARFPGGLVDALVLERALARDDADARAHALLGHWQYFHRRYDDAVRHLEASAALDPGDAAVHRGLGLAAYNVAHDGAAAAAHYERALALAPDDPKVLVEADQLARRNGVAPDDRERRLAARPEVVALRDDLTIAWAELLTLTGDAGTRRRAHRRPAVQPVGGRRGRGAARLDARAAGGRPPRDRRGRSGCRGVALRAALEPPANLGEARHPLANCSDLLLALGDALDLAGRADEARATLGRRPRRAPATSRRCSPCRTRR